jgi:acetyltransferase
MMQVNPAMPVLPHAGGRFRPQMLFRPRSVAVIGAASPAGGIVLRNLRGGSFAGPIAEIADAAALAAEDVGADLAIVCVAEVDAIFAALAARGIRAAVVTGGAEDVAAAARRSGVRALGPHSIGIAVPAIGLNATTLPLPPRAGRLALVSQSAAIGRAVLDWAAPNGVGFSHVVGLGANHDIGFAIVLDWLSRDSGTGAILLDIRRIKDARLFLSAARAAARLRPVVALRPGGRLDDPSGEAEAAFGAALRRTGVLCVDSLDDLLAAAETLTRARPARGETLAIVANALGPARLAADAALREGLHLAVLSDQTRRVLEMLTPTDKATGSEGPDLTTEGIITLPADQSVRLAETAALLAGAKEVGGVLIVHAPAGEGDDAAMAAIAAAHSVRVPLLACVMGETTGAAHRRVLAEAGVPVFASPGQAVRGFLHLVQDRRNRAAARELPPSAVLTLAPDRAEVRRVLAAARAAGRTCLLQDEAMAVLAAYGVPTVPGRAVTDPEGAADAACLLGFPVVLKRRRIERTDPPGVAGLALDLRHPLEVSEAAHRLGGSHGFLVQRQAGRARELLIRFGDDPLFGPVIVFGQGGTAADILRDFARDLPPLNLPLARALIARTRVAATLAALHDQPAANVEAVAETLVRVSQLRVDFPEIAELEINPLFADAQGVLVADGWMRLRAAGEAPSRLAIPPYPAELIGRFDARAEALTIRPIRPEDAEGHGAMFARLSPEDIRFRFFATLRELSAEQIARMTQIDYDREMAFVAVRAPPPGQPAQTVGVARLVRETDDTGEFAVIVQGEMRGTGLARHLMGRLIDWARAQGVREVVGQVLADNQPMLGFIRHLGFSLRHMPDDASVMEARLSLPLPTERP